MKTRTYLYLMAAAILIPVALAFWFGVAMLLDWERESRIHRVQETARSTALLVDREIAVKEALLRVIANSEALEEGNYGRVYRLASRLNGAEALSWTILVDEHTRPIFNTLRPFGTRLDGAPQAVQVKTGATDGEIIEIVSGIAEGDQVITATRAGTRAGAGQARN